MDDWVIPSLKSSTSSSSLVNTQRIDRQDDHSKQVKSKRFDARDTLDPYTTYNYQSRSKRTLQYLSERRCVFDSWQRSLEAEGIPNLCLQGISAMYRASCNSSALPPSSIERTIIKMVLDGLGLNVVLPVSNYRTCINYGIFTTASGLTYSFSMLVPAIITSTIVLPRSCSDIATEAKYNVIVDEPSSSGKDKASIINENPDFINVLGRLATSVLSYLEYNYPGEMVYPPKCKFVHLGNTKLVLKIVDGCTLSKFEFGESTAEVIYSILRDKCACSFDSLSGISVLPDGRQPRDDDGPNSYNIRADRSKITITTEGDIRVQGSPDIITPAYNVLQKVLYTIASSWQNFTRVLSSMNELT